MAMINLRDAFVRTLDFQRRGELERSELGFRKLVEITPDFAAPRRHLIKLLWETGRHEEALAHQRELYRRQPEPDHAFDLATRLLALGLYKEGWEHFESRAMLAAGDHRAQLPTPEWKGETVGSMVVWDEQGAGDTIQFARFLPRLQQAGIQITFVCRPELADLIATMGIPVVPSRGVIKVPPHDAWVMLNSLPHHLGVTMEGVAVEGPYLSVPPNRRSMWTTDRRIGVVGRGNPRHTNDVNRSLPAGVWERLLKLPGAVSLHPGEAFAFADFADTAAVVERLDLVITVDTAVAHLAGALGKPCWVLLPFEGADWRWLLGRNDSPWYPSLQLYRQPAPGDWNRVIEAVTDDLARF